MTFVSPHLRSIPGRSLAPLPLPLAVCALAVAVAGGCASSQPSPTSRAPEAAPASSVRSPVRLTDITKAAGITFRHNTGAFGLKWMPEVMGSGVAFLDFDGDGWQDLFFVNGRDWTRQEVRQYLLGPVGAEERRFYADRLKANPQAPPGRTAPPHTPRRTTGALYRNNGDGTFTDVTRGSGLDVEMYGMGAAVGDYDNDGRDDLFVTAYGRTYLFRNASAPSSTSGSTSGASPSRARPRFVEVAQEAGVREGGWSTSAAWLDYDKDGRLDLFVCRYLKWSPAQDPFFAINLEGKSYTGPRGRDAQSNRLYRNLGGGRFADVSRRAGILPPTAAAENSIPEPERSNVLGLSLGVVVLDHDGDSWPDIIVANDATRNHLFANYGDGTFVETAIEKGIAFDSKGKPRAGMGIDAGDLAHEGRESVVVGNFHHEMLGLFHNRKGFFVDVAPHLEVGPASRQSLTFGCAFLDLDLDGRLDILAANGHVQDNIDKIAHGITFAQRPLLFLNAAGPGSAPASAQGSAEGPHPRLQFHEVGLQSGPALHKPVVARGLAHADIDLDGDVDVVMSLRNSAPMLLRNDTPRAGRAALRLDLRGARGNRSAIGAVVRARVGRETLLRRVRSGSSYLSQSELPITLGLGSARKVESLSIEWPSGSKTLLQNMAANQILAIQEGKGVIGKQPLRLPSR